MKLQSIKPLQSSVRKLHKKNHSNTVVEKKRAQNSSSCCEPSESLDPMEVASQATVLVYSNDDESKKSSTKNGTAGKKQLKKLLFRRKQKDVSTSTTTATSSSTSNLSIGTVATDASTPDSSSENTTKLLNHNNNRKKKEIKVQQRVKQLAKEQCSVAVEKTAATGKTMKKLAKEQCAVAAEKTAEKTAETREKVKRVKNLAQEQCSVASKRTIFKITDYLITNNSNNNNGNNKTTKQRQHQPMLTTTTDDTSNQDGVEISLASLPLSVQNERFKHLRTYRRAAGKKYAKVAQKLSSLRIISGEEEEEEDDNHNNNSSSDGEEDHELSPLNESQRNRMRMQHDDHDSQQEDCPICLGTMSEHDWQHPLQCKTPQCQYNFCASCVANLIHSSQDAYALASDGSNQVKVHLTCPNCRDDLTHSLKRTLLLRLADDDNKSGGSPQQQQERTNQMMQLVSEHLPFTNQATLNDKQKLMQLDHLDMEIYRARAQEREFLNNKSCSSENNNKKKKKKKKRRSSKRRSSRLPFRRSSNAASASSGTPSTTTTPAPPPPPPRVDSGIRVDGEDNNDLQLYQDLLAANGNNNTDLRFKRESSFPVNQTTCFYIDTQVNLGGKNPARLRFQM